MRGHLRGWSFSAVGSAGAPGEAETIADHLRHLHPVFIDGDEAAIDGGDVLFCADRVLIGLSERTNRAGAEQLRAALRSVQADLRVDFVPFEGVLHLKSGLTELAPGVLVKSPSMKTDYAVESAETVMLPPEESYAADVLPVNETLIVPAGYPSVMALAEKHYTKICALDMSEFQKMDGGVTCLTLRY
jgi:dimethylargininase